MKARMQALKKSILVFILITSLSKFAEAQFAPMESYSNEYATEAMKAGLDYHIDYEELAEERDTKNRIIHFGKESYAYEEIPEIVEELRPTYEAMSPEKQKRFQKARRFILKYAGYAMLGLGKSFGSGMVIGGNALESGKLIIKRYFIQDTEFRPEFSKLSEIKQTRSKTIRGILTGIDVKLFQRMNLIAETNEAGMNIEAGLGTIAGVNNKGEANFINFGINIGWNQQEKAMVFQIHQSVENYHSAVGGAVFGGAIFKFGGYAGNHNNGDVSKTQRGESFYPPVIFTSDTTKKVYAGMSTGFGVPPASDFYIYRLRVEDGILLRVAISPLKLKFFKMEMSMGMMKPTAVALKNIIIEFLKYAKFVPPIAWKVLNYPLELSKGSSYVKRTGEIIKGDLNAMVQKFSKSSSTESPGNGSARLCRAIYIQ